VPTFLRHEVLLLPGGRRRTGNPLISTVAASQDLIGLVEFLHGKVSVEFRMIQDIHCALSSCRMTGEGWMKAFALHLLQISHSQWIFHNFTLHNKQRGYLCLLKRATVLKEVDWLLDTVPEDIPSGSQYLLELDYSALFNPSLARQSYWVLAMKAACCAGKQDATASKHRGCSQRKLWVKASTQKPRYNFSWEEARLQHELGISRHSMRRLLTGQAGVNCASNMRLRKPD
jgi:hypothetical protein